MTAPVHLVRGSDDILRSDALTKLVDDLVGDADRTLVLDEFDLDHTTLGTAVDAAQTPPFLTDRRIVVIRRFGRFSKNDEIAGILDYLADPLPSSEVVLVWEKPVNPTETGESAARSPRIPPALTKAVKAAGGVVHETDAPTGRNLAGWVDAQLTEAGLRLDPAARNAVLARLGEDVGALVGLIERLRPAFGGSPPISLDDLTPYLGEAGGVPPWDLTDAIDSGRVPDALDKLRRMLGAGDRHPLAVMATLQNHYVRMLRLDGSGARNERDAADLLGIRGSTFPAKKALTQSNRLGSRNLRRAIELLAEADIDLRGGRAWPGELVMEVLVARLTALSRPR